jgi:hypothetical protein
VRDRNARQRRWRRERRGDAPPKPKTIVGIDGEGLNLDVRGRRTHQYLYLAAWTRDEKLADLDVPPVTGKPGEPSLAPDADGTSEHSRGVTLAVFETLLSLPQDALVIGFSLGYDYAKWFEGLPNHLLYDLPRPERRQGKHGPGSRTYGEWFDDDGTCGFYRLNYVKGRFSLRKVLQGEHVKKCPVVHERRGWRHECPGCRPKRRVTVWDIFAFFQASFVRACKEWGVVTEEEFREIEAMKLRRGQFTLGEWPEVKDYCGQECKKLAELGERLTLAHEEAGLKLTSYYGAGSTASRMLKVAFDAQRFIGPTPPEMRIAVASAFFGGRFEVSRIGPVARRCWSYDIASAYPYQFTFLPCLAHGRWELVRGRSLQRRIEGARIAIVRYDLPATSKVPDVRDLSSSAPWGPFPFRAHGLNDRKETASSRSASSLAKLPSNGSILYPAASGGGWVYGGELLAGQRYFDNVVPREAWIYHQACACRPFCDAGNRPTMPEQYKKRLEWGKEGRGIVIKLGTNSCYGKTAQSVGEAPPFQSFVWAGMVTSGCRAMLLDAMARAGDWREIVMTATDGIVSTRRLRHPDPADTDTAEAARAATLREGKLKLQLGAWEEKELESGVHVVRPGIGFPLDLSVAPKDGDLKARGIGKSVLARCREEVLAHWREHPGEPFDVEREMFFGMKSSVDPPALAKGERLPKRRAVYGTWGTQVQRVSYLPFPKRPREVGEDGLLRTWAFGRDLHSAPYERLLGGEPELPPEVLAEREWDALLEDQPDRDEEDSAMERFD